MNFSPPPGWYEPEDEEDEIICSECQDPYVDGHCQNDCDDDDEYDRAVDDGKRPASEASRQRTKEWYEGR